MVLYKTHSTSTAHNVNSKVSAFFRPHHSISIKIISTSATQETREAQVRPDAGMYINLRDQISESDIRITCTRKSQDSSHFFFCQVKRRRQHSRPAGSSSWPLTSQLSSSWPATPPIWCHPSRPRCTSCHSTVLKNSSKQAHITL